MPEILITLGDPAGIGPEVIDAALASPDLPEGFTFTILGDRTSGSPGQPTKASAQSAYDALRESTRRLRETDAAAVVTGPVSKEGLQSLGFQYPGQTEFFTEELSAGETGMLLTGPNLSVGLATIHIPLAEVPMQLTQESIVTIGRLTAEFLRKKGIESPEIAVCGLNPHAGENGAFGTEETTTISPAIEQLNSLGLANFTGPHVPDAIFRDAAQGKYQAVIAMYHDQGLIPLKLLDFDEAVNVTLGLPKPRTSPDHGTAFGIAGKGIASHASMLAAIKLACQLA
ncbi:4-hydroxythreonine-4-phosphate dehydrogenase PdxA [Luteolibacter sp. AS25]|uniref:4-hydroxythreonine-4-phosphate dehydrogenase PdxA n=1 Tax=Luteolibacter sp. AS25 TaxID=3135776 RepID=UPI00398AADCB